MRIALAGNPNSGKTTMFNAVTGQNEKVGNWAGVTVEKKEHPIKKALYSGAEELIAVDLPGAYSMSPFTSEESVTRDYIHNENPDVLINIVDATNLSRSLFFTTQLLELGIPTVIALNKADINEKKETVIDAKLLSEKLGCPVIDTVSTVSEGVGEVVEAAAKRFGEEQKAPYEQGEIDLTDKEAVLEADRKRFEFVNKIVKEVETRKVLTSQKTKSDKIDEIITSRWLGIPLFAVVMSLVFLISQHENGLGVIVANVITGFIENFQGWAGEMLSGASPILTALLIDGIIGGVGAVLGFLGQQSGGLTVALAPDVGGIANLSSLIGNIDVAGGLGSAFDDQSIDAAALHHHSSVAAHVSVNDGVVLGNSHVEKAGHNVSIVGDDCVIKYRKNSAPPC